MVIVDLHNNNEITRKPTKKADAGLMHTKENIIVLRGTSKEMIVRNRLSTDWLIDWLLTYHYPHYRFIRRIFAC